MDEVFTTRKRKMDDLLETGVNRFKLLEDLSEIRRLGLDKVETGDDRLEDLLEIPGFDKVDILYSRRYRKQVREILDRIPMKVRAPEIVDEFGKKIRFLRRERLSIQDISSDEDSDDDDDDITALRKWFYRVAKCEKRLKLYETKVGTCWHSLCFPCAPGEYFPPLARILSPVVLERTKQVEAFDVDYVRSARVSRLLGRFLVDQNGHRRSSREACRGKHVLVCCISFPVLSESELDAFQFLINLCSELSTSERHDVQVVMVPKIFSLADTSKAFYHLFSAFPKSCLAVPYHEDGLKDVARLLSRGTVLPRCIVYGQDGRFLKSFCAKDDESFPYGAEAFPFTKEKVREVVKKRALLQTDRLENLLRPYEWSRPDDVVVYDFEKRPRPLSEVVKNKHVGLYLCSEGSLFRRLLKLCKHCKSKELEFEIVMLYLPQLSEADPHTFAEMGADVLAEHEVRGWWRLPFNNSVSLRFCHLTKDYDIGEGRRESREDKLIIVGPDGKILDMYGGQAIKKDYRFDAHPFTRAAVVENRMRQLRDVKLESLVAGGSFFRGDDPNHAVSAQTLLISKKKIIIYFGKPKRLKEHLGALVSQYEEMRRNGDEFEVVIVDSSGPRSGNKYGAIPWYICCCRPGTDLVKTLSELVKLGSLVGFGEDGRICSVKRLHKYKRFGFRKDVPAALCLEDTLLADLYHYFQFDKCRAI